MRPEHQRRARRPGLGRLAGCSRRSAARRARRRPSQPLRAHAVLSGSPGHGLRAYSQRTATSSTRSARQSPPGWKKLLGQPSQGSTSENTRGSIRDSGSLDVVPFVSLRRGTKNLVCNGPIEEALEARAEFMTWAAAELGLPCFAYGPERSLPEVRRRAFSDLQPDAGPPEPHPTAGSCAVGARPILVAYNLWISGELELALSIARAIRGPAVRGTRVVRRPRRSGFGQPDRSFSHRPSSGLRPGRGPRRGGRSRRSSGPSSSASCR